MRISPELKIGIVGGLSAVVCIVTMNAVGNDVLSFVAVFGAAVATFAVSSWRLGRLN
ncbi:hypothetical protein [Candidatus Viadribacter manganicus]|uniref:hypothetical protein n=1 Tax=Candidatus Viadribacter manganicus TaxID=1759059 RepID=UPI0012EA5EFB|nr:hypothetical protein [Candidatus Viadribacter manganicus]